MDVVMNPSADEIASAFRTGRVVTLVASVMAGEERSARRVRVIDEGADTLVYTTDGVWFTRVSRSDLVTWVDQVELFTEDSLVSYVLDTVDADGFGVVELDAGVLVMTADEARDVWDTLAPGEGFRVWASATSYLAGCEYVDACRVDGAFLGHAEYRR